jgi:hypothetical protein
MLVPQPPQREVLILCPDDLFMEKEQNRVCAVVPVMSQNSAELVQPCTPPAPARLSSADNQ